MVALAQDMMLHNPGQGLDGRLLLPRRIDCRLRKLLAIFDLCGSDRNYMLDKCWPDSVYE